MTQRKNQTGLKEKKSNNYCSSFSFYGCYIFTLLYILLQFLHKYYLFEVVQILIIKFSEKLYSSRNIMT